MEFSEMTGPQLVDVYNRMALAVGARPITKFESRIVGIERCKKLAKNVTVDPPVENPGKEQFVEEAVAPVPAKPPLPEASRSKKSSRVIRLLCKENPRREGTDAHKYFEAMKGSPTVGEYLAKFPTGDQKKAAQWLWNTCRDGHAELLG